MSGVAICGEDRGGDLVGRLSREEDSFLYLLRIYGGLSIVLVDFMFYLINFRSSF